MPETRVQSLGSEDPLEKDMATHSSIFAWLIPWTEDPGRLQSIGSTETDMTERLSTYRGTECRFGIGPGSFLVIIKEGVEYEF